MEVVKHLEGAYALLIKSTAYPGELVACKRGSPLILGIRETPTGRGIRLSSVHDAREQHLAGALECFVASDASAVVEHTKQCALDLQCSFRMCHLGWSLAIMAIRVFPFVAKFGCPFIGRFYYLHLVTDYAE